MHATLFYERQLVKRDFSNRKYTTAYFNLTAKQCRKVSNLAKKQDKSESEVLRQMLDAYLKQIKNKPMAYEPCRKLSFQGYNVLPRTITKEQDRKLRKLKEQTDRAISELAREAVERY